MRKDALTHVLYDRRQFIGTDMGMCFVEHGIRGTEIMEKFHHPLHVTAFLGAGEEFAVGKSTGSSFPETVVGFGIEPLVAVEQCDILFAFTHFFSALIDDRFDAMLD